ncbi:tRNA (guanine(10)-N2)-methyltransferase homolog [Planococcus citri]|uniref:tRNA (guanine(10)-N2)-methyltransferase homolog n=1 Tax=Planococcus citri TaxID=170843 RepID=UPI0031F7EED7
MAMKNLKKYLLWFANDHVDFRLSEIEAIASLFKTTIIWKEEPSHKPFWIVELPSDEVARQIANRSVTLKFVTELWASSNKIEDLHNDLKTYSSNVLQHDEVFKKSSFKFKVDVFCNTQSYAEKMAKIETFSYLPIKGPVKLADPDITFQYCEFYGTDPNNVPAEPYHLFFGKLISKSKRKLIHDFSLKKRKFIGNTSMDPEMSLIMANHAKVEANDLVYDPFVGSGSLLVAAAYFGAYVSGVDIDFLMVHGKTKPTRKQTRHIARQGENVLANLTQYGMESKYLDVLVGDSSLPLWRNELKFDAIITDPPYGIREATERVGSKKSRTFNDPEAAARFPPKVIYTFHQILSDLLFFSSSHLNLGGRLVTWIPVFREDYSESTYIPEHPCFKLISNCEQVLSRVVSRRLLTFEKLREPTDEDLELCKIEDNKFREKYFNYKYNKSSS